jgi:hypothetical protein
MYISRMVIEGLEIFPVNLINLSSAGCNQALRNESQSMLSECQQEGASMPISCKLKGGDVIRQQLLLNQVATCTRKTHREAVNENA